MRAFSTFGLGGFQRGSYDDTTLDRPRRLRPSAWGLDERLPEVCNDTGLREVRVFTHTLACVGQSPPQDHPHITLKIGANGSIVCPYCATKFVFANGA